MTENEKMMMQQEMSQHAAGHGCPGSRFMQLDRTEEASAEEKSGSNNSYARPVSRLN